MGPPSGAITATSSRQLPTTKVHVPSAHAQGYSPDTPLYNAGRAEWASKAYSTGGTGGQNIAVSFQVRAQRGVKKRKGKASSPNYEQIPVRNLINRL